ncbi:MAG TPA: hypothetical protein VKZ49_14855, partial [Polyangiaceae bacterium]|nr:hypothetical protein [Polyangiaceae bacterium]
ADLYSLALVLYTMLRGKEPYAHLKPGKRLLAAQAEQTLEPPSPPTIERLSTTLWEILRIPLAKDPARRFASATAFIRALEQLEADRERVMALGHDGGNDLPLTAKQHAQMTAEIELYPDDAGAIRARFGVAAAAAWGQAQEQWRRTIASNPNLKRKWEEEVERHRQHLANATASERDTWGSHASVP